MLDERQILFCELLVLTGCRAVDGFVQEVNALNSYCAGPPLSSEIGDGKLQSRWAVWRGGPF